MKFVHLLLIGLVATIKITSDPTAEGAAAPPEKTEVEPKPLQNNLKAKDEKKDTKITPLSVKQLSHDLDVEIHEAKQHVHKGEEKLAKEDVKNSQDLVNSIVSQVGTKQLLVPENREWSKKVVKELGTIRDQHLEVLELSKSLGVDDFKEKNLDKLEQVEKIVKDFDTISL